MFRASIVALPGQPFARMIFLWGLCMVLPAAWPTTAEADQAAGRSATPWNLTKRDEDLTLRLVTFGPGDSVHQYWGHNALWVEDRARGASALYNFGMFGFGADMLAKYLRGQLEFWVAATPARRTFQLYKEDNRSIRIQELDLSPARRRYLAERLAWYAQPEHRNYRYHHYSNNCSTKLRDLLNEATEGQLEAQSSKPARLDYRGHTRRYTEHDPAVHFALVLWMNDSMERAIRGYEEAFLPDELERIVGEVQLTGADGKKRPLVKLGYTLFEARRAPVPESPSTVWPGLLGLGCALGALALLLGRKRKPPALRVAFGLYQAAIGTTLGTLGLVLGLFLFTGWKVTHWNENLLLTNPLTFLALPFGLMLAFGAKRGEPFMRGCWLILAGSSVLHLMLKVLPNFDQQTYLVSCLYLPVNVGFAAAYWLRART